MEGVLIMEQKKLLLLNLQFFAEKDETDIPDGSETSKKLNVDELSDEEIKSHVGRKSSKKKKMKLLV